MKTLEEIRDEHSIKKHGHHYYNACYRSLISSEDEGIIAERYAQQAMDEREVMIRAFVKIREEFEGRKWLMEGRGPYEWDDDEYKQEVRYIMDAFNDIEKKMWKDIKSKTFEYRNQIKEDAVNAVLQEVKSKIDMAQIGEADKWDEGFNAGIERAKEILNKIKD